MKFSKQPATFRPISITIESETELENLINIMIFASGTHPIKSQRMLSDVIMQELIGQRVA